MLHESKGSQNNLKRSSKVICFPLIIACSKAGRNNRKLPQLIYLRHKKAKNRYFFFVPKGKNVRTRKKERLIDFLFLSLLKKNQVPHPISLISLMFLLGLVDELKTTGCKNLIFMDKKCFFVPMCVRIILFKGAWESVSPHRSAWRKLQLKIT